MAKADVLDRAARDLSRGRTHPALQRLSSLVAAHPTDLDLRRRLALVHLSVGNLVEAGRWQYLHEDADPDAAAAFERAHPLPGPRLRALRWPGGSAGAPTGFARAQLDRLAALAGTTSGHGTGHSAGTTGGAPATTTRSRGPAWFRALRGPVRLTGAAAVLLLAVGFATVGAVTVLQWLL